MKYSSRLIRFVWASSLLIWASCSSVETGNQVWYKENGTIEERDRLLAAAQIQAQQTQQVPTVSNPGTPGSQHQSTSHVVLEYMTANGWRLVPKSQAKPLPEHPPTKDKPATKVSSTGLGR